MKRRHQLDWEIGGTNLEAPRLDSAHGGRPHDLDALLVGEFDEFAGVVLWDALGDDSHSPDLGEVHGLHSALVRRPHGREADESVGLGVSAHRVCHALVQGNEDLFVPKVELL